jgi:hypothetical protein
LIFAKPATVPHYDPEAPRFAVKSHRRLLFFVLAVAALFVMAPGEAAARGKRAVPDLRRDAERWSVTQNRALIRIPITVHVARGTSGSAPRRVERWVQRANAAFESYGIRVYVRAVRYLPDGFEAVTRWKERRQLAAYAPSDGTIHVFAIDELDKPRRVQLRRRVRGLHWRYRGLNPRLREREYVVVTESAPMTTLAHELGHMFGLRHSSSSDNIMCSCRRGSNVSFTADQGRDMRDGADSFVARHDGGGWPGAGVADRR